MPCAYIGKTKIIIPTISSGTPVSCILVDLITWEGPLEAGKSGRYVTERLAIPIGQAGIQHHKNCARAFDPETGIGRANINRGCANFSDAIGKRLSWSKPPIPNYGNERNADGI